MKNWVLPVALILLTASIVYAATKVEFKGDDNNSSQWMIYRPGSHNTGSAVAEIKADSPSVKALAGTKQDNVQGYK